MNEYGGAIIELLSESDFVAGVNSPLVVEQLNTTKNWEQDLGQGEVQDRGFGTYSCVSQSCSRAISARLNLMIRSGILPNDYPHHYAFLKNNNYLNANGQVDLSERFLAIASHTNPVLGNSGRAVYQAARDNGMCSEALCPQSGPKSVSEWYSMPSGAIQQAQQFKTYFDISWEAVPLYLVDQYLAQSPVAVFIPICDGYGTDNPVKACNDQVIHAVLKRKADSPQKHIMDSYVPYFKDLASNYPTPYAFQATVRPIPSLTPKPHYTFSRDLVYGERSQDVFHLQDVLRVPMSGQYDEATRVAVFQYQLKHLLPTFKEMVLNLFGRRVGKLTRAELNKEV